MNYEHCGSNWRDYDKNHNEFVNQKFCKCLDCIRLRIKDNSQEDHESYKELTN